MLPSSNSCFIIQYISPSTYTVVFLFILKIPTAKNPLTTPFQFSQPEFRTFEPQMQRKPIQVEPSMILPYKSPTIPIIRPRPSVLISLTTHISQPMLISYS